MQLPLTAIVLAGGQSRRFGSDKALALLEGRPLLQHVLERLLKLTSDVLVVAERPSRFEALRAQLPPTLRWEVEAVPGQGPLGGLARGLELARHPWSVLTACDAPLLEAELIQLLAERSTHTSALAVVPFVADRWQPMPAVYHRALLPLLQEQLDKKALKVVDLFSKIQVDCLVEHDIYAHGATEWSFRSVNTPEVLLEVQRHLAERNADHDTLGFHN